MIHIGPRARDANPLAACAAHEKQQHLFAQLRDVGSVLVAFSGGADSAYLAWAAHRTLGERALAVTALSPSFSACDREQAEAFVRQTGLHRECIATGELENPLYVANQADRCYHCKNELFTALDRIARQRGFAAVAYGLNADDLADFRPGHRAAAEHRVLAPLLDAALTKAEIRVLSRLAGLPTWDRPASACLSSRIPYGTAVTPAALGAIERAEAAVRALGFRQVRVRYFGELARVEVAAEELPRAIAMDLPGQLSAPFRAFGFTRVELDPRGYRQGSLNEGLRSQVD
jgi:uncharacterized protein